MAHRRHIQAHLRLMLARRRLMLVRRRLMLVPQRLMLGHRRPMLQHRHPQLRPRRATMGTVPQLLVYTPPRPPPRTRLRRQGRLESRHLEPTARRRLLSAKPRPRTRTTADLVVHSMHSVRGMGSIPRLHLADEHAEEHKNWLLDFRIPGLNIKFKDNSEWFGGKFDGQQVKLVAVLEGASGRDNHTATVQFPDRDETGGVPIEILQPVYPEGQEYRGFKAVLLQDSIEVGRQVSAAKMGEIVVLNTYGDKEWLCERTQDRQTNEDIEMREMALCLWSELDM